MSTQPSLWEAFLVAILLTSLSAHAQPPMPAATYDILIRNGEIYDGSGDPPYAGTIAIKGDKIVAVGPAGGPDLAEATAPVEIDASGLAVAPGFINMLSWANVSLIHDGRSMGDIHQGVTLEVLGEGNSMGPLNEEMRRRMVERQDDIRYDVEWTTLGEYLDYMERRGVSCNVASFMGATTARKHVLGWDDVDPTPEQLDEMRALVRQAMEDGAVGVSTALIYTPASFAETDEIVALAEVAAEYGGIYISHLRSESDQLLEGVDELIEISERSGAPAEIYHLKASGRKNWHKLETVFERIESARARGVKITTDMYMYNASSTGLDAIMPSWVQEGGHAAWVERLKDPAVRERLRDEILDERDTSWDNGWLSAGSAENVLLVGFRSEALKPLTGKTLAEVAEMRGTEPLETAFDLVIEDDSRVGCVFFTMSEDNIRRKIQQPWMSFCSDSGSMAPEGIFLERGTHPRAYGSFARLLGRYVRDEKLVPLEEAIRRLTSLPAENLSLDRRGRLREGYYADVVVFDPETIQDHATFAKPHQLATGVAHVFVNGGHVLKDGVHTGATPGRAVRGPGYRGERPR